GAGGGHKRRRGFIARPAVSLHRWYHPGMDSLIRAWLPKVNGLMIKEIEAMNEDLPFRVEQPPLSFVG
ncbi:MAG: peptidogalycan biosysnthesis protein, partial [Prochlorococcus sp.]